MGQALKDVPKTRAEYRRQKGPVPPVALLLGLGIIAVFCAFFGPTIFDMIFGNS